MKFILKLIGKILKGIWLTINFIRQFILNVIFFMILGAIVIGFATFHHQETPSFSGEHILTINFDGRLVEKRQLISQLNQFSHRYLGTNLPQEIDIHQLSYSIDHARHDPRIKGLVLNVNDLRHSSLANLKTVGDAIERFKKSGKPVIAVANNYDQSQYYLASFANQVILNPAGAVILKGLSANQLYYKDALNKLGVQTHVFRVGLYKSFVEPYTRNNMSPLAKADLTRWLNEMWSMYTHQIGENRHISPDDVAPKIDRLLAKLKAVDGDAAQYALNAKLVDHLYTPSQTHYYLNKLFTTKHHSTYRKISYKDYAALTGSMYDHRPSSNAVAVLTATGPIVSGDGTQEMIASKNMLKALDKVAHNSSIKALVLRLNTPGGSAFAAEQIRNKLMAIQRVGKPVIISMGAMAASGGYWISANSDQIFAQPSTITGSIGIFGLFATAQNGLAKLGIHHDGVATTDYATISPIAPLSKGVKEVIQLNVEHGYHQFISLVKKGRNFKTLAQVDHIAQGRIWLGSEAKKIGLVDQLGGLNQAIAYAAKKANLQHYNLIDIPLYKDAPNQLIGTLLHSQMGRYLNSSLPWLSPLLSQDTPSSLSLLRQDPKHLFSYCSWCKAL